MSVERLGEESQETPTEDEGLLLVARLIDEAGVEATAHEVEMALRVDLPWSYGPPEDRESEPTAPDVEKQAAAFAFGYRVIESRVNGGRRISFEPYFQSGQEQWPPPIDTVEDGVVDVWESLARLVTTPYPKARLEHLLFQRRRGNGRDRVRAAVENYLRAAECSSRGIDRVDHLSTALRLARAVHDADLASTTMDQMLRTSARELAETGPRPGIVIRLLALLVDEPNVPPQVDDLLRDFGARFADPHQRDEVIALQIKRTNDPTVREQLDADRVQLWLDAAAMTSGILRAMHLKTALERANSTQRANLIDRAAAELQKINVDELGLVSFSASTAISSEEVERIIAPITEAGGWGEALLRFGFFGPMTGAVDDNRRQAAEMSKQFVFSHMLPRIRLGGDGLPRYEVKTPEDKAEDELTQQEIHRLNGWAPIFTRAGLEIAVRFGVPTEAELAEFFAELPSVAPKLAPAIARVFLRHWTGDYEGAALTAAPCIETLTRDLVLSTGAGVYRLQRERKPGQYPGLGTLLGVLLERGMDESWYRFLYTLCVNPAGWNVRNEIAHGFVYGNSPALASYLLQAVVYLASLQATPDKPKT